MGILSRSVRNNLSVIVLTTVLLVPFQNCSKFKALDTKQGDADSSSSAPDPGGGTEVPTDTNSDGIIFTEEDFQKASDGKVLYATNCAACHSAIEKSTKLGRNFLQIKGAIGSVTQMASPGLKSLVDGDVDKIAFVLKVYKLYGLIPEVDTVAVIPGTTGSDTTGGVGNLPKPPPLTQFTCGDIAKEDPAVSPLRRLSQYQIFLTTRSMLEHLVSLLKLSGVSSDILDSDDQRNPQPGHPLSPVLSSIPKDNSALGYSRMDLSVTSEHIESYAMLASELVDYAVRIANVSSTNLPKVCMWSNPTDTCKIDFIKKFGLLAFRRPLKTTEITDFKAVYDASATTVEAGLQTLVMSFLLSPQYLLHLETEGAAIAGREGVTQLTAYELASKISYLYLDNMPDSTLFTEAQNGNLLTPTGLKAQVDRLTGVRQYDILGNPAGYWRRYTIKELPGTSTMPYVKTSVAMTYAQMHREWLGMEASTGIDNHPLNLRLGGTTTYPGKLLADNNSFSDLSRSMVYETDELFFRNIWQKKGRFSDLLTDKNSFIEHSSQAAAYGLVQNRQDWLEGRKLVSLPNHAGLLTRLRMLNTNDPTSNPIKRGVLIRTKILCDDLPHPDIDALPDRAIESPEEDPSLTTRLRYAQKTADTQCMTCHSQINPLGFAFEDFNQLGYKRNIEHVFSKASISASVVAELPINASANNLDMGVGEVQAVNGGVEMSNVLAASPKANTCFVRQVFRFSMGRYETDGDECLFSDMYNNMKDLSTQDMIRGVALHPHFKMRKVGAQ